MWAIGSPWWPFWAHKERSPMRSKILCRHGSSGNRNRGFNQPFYVLHIQNDNLQCSSQILERQIAQAVVLTTSTYLHNYLFTKNLLDNEYVDYGKCMLYEKKNHSCPWLIILFDLTNQLRERERERGPMNHTFTFICRNPKALLS